MKLNQYSGYLNVNVLPRPPGEVGRRGGEGNVDELPSHRFAELPRRGSHNSVSPRRLASPSGRGVGEADGEGIM